MTTPFDLAAVLRGHSERRLRIADMIGRRGRFVTVGMAGYLYVHFRVRRAPTSDFLFLGLQESLFDALVFSWLMLATYYSDGFLGRVAYGAQSRIMDGVLARANCLVIMTLWSVFKFIMVPLGFQLATVFPPKSVAGTAACFIGSLAICLWLVRASGLGPASVGLAVVVAVSTTALEFLSPRGTDEFTMATASALLCWGFGRLVY
jgi:hypothetical protein